MAPVNPTVPQTPDPFYLHLSRPAQEPTPDKSGSTLFKTIGGAIEDTGKLADTGIKGYLKDDVTKQMTSIDEENIAGLESTKSAIEGGTQQAAQNTQGNQPNDVLTAQGSAAVPSDIHQGINAVQMFQDVRNNGKISESDKLGRQYKVLKDIRQQWPQYRDYIDRESERITGKNVANAYANSLIGDLNASQAGKDKERDSIAATFKEMREKGIPDSAIMENRWRAGELGNNDIRVYQNRQNYFHYRHQSAQYEAEEGGWDEAKEKRIAGPLTETLLEKANHTYVSVLSDASDNADKITAAIAGGKQIDPQTARTVVAKIENTQRLAQTAMRRDMDDPKLGVNGKALSTLHGPAQTKTLIDSKLAIYDGYIKALTDGNSGAIHNLDNAYKDINSANRLSVYKDEPVGGLMQMHDVLKGISPEFDKVLTGMVIDKNLGGQPVMRTWAENKVLEFMTNKPGSPTPKATVNGLRTAPDITPIAKAKISEELIKTIEMIADPKTPDKVKENLINKAYDSQNLGFVSEFEKKNGNNLSIFGRMTDPSMAKEIWRLSGESPNNPLWQKYRSWATQSFGQEIFGDQLRQLAAAQTALGGTPHFQRGGIGGTGEGSIGWDTVNHKLIADFPNVRAFNSIRKNVNRINYGLFNIKSIAETEGTDINSYMLGELQRFGALNPEIMKGLPQEMYDSIAKQKQNEDTFKAAVKEKYKKREPQ